MLRLALQALKAKVNRFSCALLIYISQQKTKCYACIATRYRVGNGIALGLQRLEEGSNRGSRAYQEAIIDLDHVLLSDIASPSEAREIVKRAKQTGNLQRSQRLYGQYELMIEDSVRRTILS